MSEVKFLSNNYTNPNTNLEPSHQKELLTLRLLFLAVLELEAPPSSFLEEALYKCSV